MPEMDLKAQMDVTIPADRFKSRSVPGESTGSVILKGILTIPEDAKAIILFAHGSGSSRLSSRNQYVARVLNQSRIATLLFDLLTAEEEGIDEYNRQFRFDIDLLANRLLVATKWVTTQNAINDLRIGYFGASTGGAAAIVAAAKSTTNISAVVSRGGRPDLAGPYLTTLIAPTLLIVGGLDDVVIGLNQNAFDKMVACEKELTIVPGATHLFEEPGTLEKVALLAREWFDKHI